MQIVLKDLPFHIGPSNQSNNVKGIPNLLDFKIGINEQYMILEQVIAKNVIDLLGKGYSHGFTIGTPLNDTKFGSPYVEDFLEFILSNSSKRGQLLEIGAGTGFLSKRLAENQFVVTSIEPGEGYETYHKQLGIEVIKDFYPSQLITRKFDVIVMYAVLEHILDLENFLSSISNQLENHGTLFFAVPDCSQEIYNVDATMLIHEHISYFTEVSLANLLSMNGFECRIIKSNFARSLFVRAKLRKSDKFLFNSTEDMILENFLNDIVTKIVRTKNYLKQISTYEEIAIYSPSRMLNLLPLDVTYTFVDDDPHLYGKFYPPFNAQVLNFKDLIQTDCKSVFIGSRTYESEIRKKLCKSNLNVVGLEELYTNSYNYC